MDLHSHNPNMAYLYAITGNLLYAINNILFKMLSDIMTPFQILLVRSISLFLINLPILQKLNQSPYIPSDRS